VSHYGLGPFALEKYLKKAKEELWKIQIFHHAKNIPNLSKKNPLKETKILQDIILTL